jgi:hypothetical protein
LQGSRETQIYITMKLMLGALAAFALFLLACSSSSNVDASTAGDARGTFDAPAGAGPDAGTPDAP